MVNLGTSLLSLATAIEALSTTSYQDDSSSRWKRSRSNMPELSKWRELEFWIKPRGLRPGQQQTVGLIPIEIVWHQRYLIDDQYTSDGRAFAAGAALVDLLEDWHGVSGQRLLHCTFSTEYPDQSWIRGIFTADLWVGNWRA